MLEKCSDLKLHWLPSAIVFILIGAPTAALMFDRVKGYPAPKFIKTQGLAAFVAFILMTGYLWYTNNPTYNLILWGAVGGLIATVALDVVRLTGLRFRQFPMDMPQMFGAMALGVAPRIPRNVMAGMVQMLAELPEEKRGEMLEPRIRAIAALPEKEKVGFMGMIYGGIQRLPSEKREAILGTQIAILSQLPAEQRQAMMRTMDGLMMANPNPPLTGSFAPDAPFRRGAMPKIPMDIFRQLVRKALPTAAQESGVTMPSIMFVGYLWHFINGVTYGIAYTLLFGNGSWMLAFAWGTFVWLVMMVSMPRMMPMIKLPYPRFTIVPLLAHWAMALPIGFFALYFIPSTAGNYTILTAITQGLLK